MSFEGRGLVAAFDSSRTKTKIKTKTKIMIMIMIKTTSSMHWRF